MQTNEIIQVNTIDQYNKLFGIETRHPLIGIVDLNRPEQLIPYKMNIGFYALFLKEEVCGELTYGRGRYDYQEGTVVALAPGQIVGLNNPSGVKPPASKGLLFHPDLIRGTALGQEIRNYQFFSYEANEALHLSLEERRIVADCLNKIATELEHPIDKHSRRLITAHIGVLLDYCLRFYDRSSRPAASRTATSSYGSSDCWTNISKARCRKARDCLRSDTSRKRYSSLRTISATWYASKPGKRPRSTYRRR